MEKYLVIARAVAQILGPLGEVVIHDLKKGTIAFIEGTLSCRSVGDQSLIESDVKKNAESLSQTVYQKLTPDGKIINSISIPLYFEEDIKALMCINLDVTSFYENFRLCEFFVKMQSDTTQPLQLFKSDWQEKINQFIYQYTKKRGMRLDALSHKEKKIMLKLLYDGDAFKEKGAPEYLAKAVNVSRGTIFNYLRTWRKESNAT